MKLSHMPTNCRLVSVVIDERAIKEGFSYNGKLDAVDGFSDHVSRMEELAIHALVFMVTGIVEKWKAVEHCFIYHL